MRWISHCYWPGPSAQALTLQRRAQPERYGPVGCYDMLAPGGGDPANFDVEDCSTQRNLNSVDERKANTRQQLRVPAETRTGPV